MKSLSQMFHKTKSESPIEKMFEEQLKEYGIELDQQFWIGPYRIDFGMENKKIAIEVDSTQFHTKQEQIEKDNRRQDYIEKQGWIVMRVPSWMVYKQKGLCAAEIALRFYKDQLTETQTIRAMVALKRYFENEPEIFIDLHNKITGILNKV